MSIAEKTNRRRMFISVMCIIAISLLWNVSLSLLHSICIPNELPYSNSNSDSIYDSSQTSVDSSGELVSGKEEYATFVASNYHKKNAPFQKQFSTESNALHETSSPTYIPEKYVKPLFIKYCAHSLFSLNIFLAIFAWRFAEYRHNKNEDKQPLIFKRQAASERLADFPDSPRDMRKANRSGGLSGTRYGGGYGSGRIPSGETPSFFASNSNQKITKNAKSKKSISQTPPPSRPPTLSRDVKSYPILPNMSSSHAKNAHGRNHTYGTPSVKGAAATLALDLPENSPFAVYYPKPAAPHIRTTPSPPPPLEDPTESYGGSLRGNVPYSIRTATPSYAADSLRVPGTATATMKFNGVDAHQTFFSYNLPIRTIKLQFGETWEWVLTMVVFNFIAMVSFMAVGNRLDFAAASMLQVGVFFLSFLLSFSLSHALWCSVHSN